MDRDYYYHILYLKYVELEYEVCRIPSIMYLKLYYKLCPPQFLFLNELLKLNLGWLKKRFIKGKVYQKPGAPIRNLIRGTLKYKAVTATLSIRHGDTPSPLPLQPSPPYLNIYTFEY